MSGSRSASGATGSMSRGPSGRQSIADLLAIANHMRAKASGNAPPTVPMPTAQGAVRPGFRTVASFRASDDDVMAPSAGNGASAGASPGEPGRSQRATQGLPLIEHLDTGVLMPADGDGADGPWMPAAAGAADEAKTHRRDTIQALRDSGLLLFDPVLEDTLYPAGVVAADVETLPILQPQEAERGKPVESKPPALVPDKLDNLTFLASPGEGEHRTLRALLAQMQRFGANDLHLMIGEPPAFRLDGEIRRLDHQPLAWEHMRTFVYAVVTQDDLNRLDSLADRYNAESHQRDSSVVPEIDVTYSYAGTSYRCNVALESMGICLSMRRIPAQPPSLKDLRMPKAIDTALTEPSGLILIAGPTGAGKTTTMAALLDRLIRAQAVKVITIEDPIEYVYPRGQYPALVSQRQIARDTHTFATGIKAALRQDPDIIVVGELLDVEATTLALQAAQTGHLVFATIHAGAAAEVPGRVVDFFPAEQRATIAAQLASVLRLFTFQQILPKIGGGLVPAFAVTPVTPAIRKNIDAGDKIALVNSCRQSAKEHGGCTLSDSVEFLLEKNIVEWKNALVVLSPDEREDMSQRLRT